MKTDLSTRRTIFLALFPEEAGYRLEQLNRALFDVAIKDVAQVSTLSAVIREKLTGQLPWSSLSPAKVLVSAKKDTYKTLLKTTDGYAIETVLMRNVKASWTICVSSQVGCAMACSFCATGTMGLKRSLSSDEIIDQYRFWQQFTTAEKLPGRISNIVFMGMGEPLVNYDAVKETIQLILKYTDIGPAKITVSTVGILPQLQQLLNDPDWPHVRLAVSLHSAVAEIRKKIVPSSTPNFLQDLKAWTLAYGKKLGNRSHYLTFEYILLKGVNDSAEDAAALAKYARACGVKKINVIPYNTVAGKDFSQSEQTAITVFKQTVRTMGVDVTQRKNMGSDIAAACGQLVTLGLTT
ncbi:MAG: hypothetical protein A2788_01335 [Candidatus Abawacabacteria bacterium RIFCSPHIGHO2_01_FULL_46_8]|uniref:Radical SAM core domain-containing protein n=1 Tax=Candidatus Abawacabacteria bacterium RIFCSPHIGHO2_01_FULL_46_8 TaxID=1817815 RepID=A0A1F4XME6_9BACT|nr:MAG: hypothetical protein A2788_01335 [Candidatus Abawacabacteria bacterium RIFCSPHIGHO2_01_FULL_46_8]